MAETISTESLIVARFITHRAIDYFGDLPLPDREFIGKLRVCEFELESELEQRRAEIDEKSKAAMFPNHFS